MGSIVPFLPIQLSSAGDGTIRVHLLASALLSIDFPECRKLYSCRASFLPYGSLEVATINAALTSAPTRDVILAPAELGILDLFIIGSL